MVLVLLLGLFFVAVAFALLARSLLWPRLRAAEAVRSVEAYGFPSAEAPGPAGSTGRSLPQIHLKESIDSVALRIGGSISTRSKNDREENLKKTLQAAGFYSTNPRRFIGYQALATIVLGLLFIWSAIAGNTSPLMSIILIAVALFCGWTLPLTFVKRRARMRAERIDLDMPDLIDMLVASVEAGVAFGSALQMATRRLRGPLGEELRLTLQEQSMGLGLNDALNNMLWRQDTLSVRAFVRSLVHGEQLGVSIGQTLRNLSTEMRDVRRQIAEERAQKAPIKLVFPVVLLILPALFVITLGPAFIRFREIFQ